MTVYWVSLVITGLISLEWLRANAERSRSRLVPVGFALNAFTVIFSAGCLWYLS